MDVAQQRAHRAWTRAERIKRLSDRVVGVGPVGIGVDGVLAWIPGANLLYSLGAGGMLAYEALQARAAPITLVRMGLYLTADSALSEIPFLGWAVDTLFQGHLMAAKALQKDIEGRHGRPPASVGRGQRGRFWPQRSPRGA